MTGIGTGEGFSFIVQFFVMATIIPTRLGVLLFCLLTSSVVFAQIDIFEVMQRKDLRLSEVEALAKRYFDSTGTERGTGYKQYQRWLYEQRFHRDEKGYLLPDDYDWQAYKNFKSKDSTLVLMGQVPAAGSTGPWVERGPWNWNRTGGWNPGVGRITAIAIHPSDTNTIYITSPGGGVWKTADGGQNWVPLTDYNSLWMNMFSVCIDPQNPNTVYAGSSANVVIKSVDGGATWVPINSGMTGIIRKVIVHPTNSNIVFVAAGNGIWRSLNGGGAWTRVFAGTSLEDIDFKPGAPAIVYASSGSIALRSADGGATWTVLGTAQGIMGSGRTLVAVSPANPERVYVAQASGNEFGALYVSDNSGLSFTTAVAGSASSCTNFFGYETTGCGSGGQAGHDMALSISPVNADEVHIGGIIVFRSLDGGKNFSPQTAWSYPNSIGYNHADVHALEWVRSTLYSASDGGIYKTTDRGDNWIDLSAGLGIRQFYRIANSKSNSQLFTGGAQDNGSSLFNNGTWIDWLGADGMEGIIHPTNTNLVWGTSQNGTVYRSTNGGQSYTTLNRPSTGEWVTPLDYDETNNAIVGGWTGVFRSTNNGDTWTRISGSTINVTLTCVAVAPSNPNYIYASKNSTLWVTRNGGTTWTALTLPAVANDIAVSPTNPEKIWIACNSTFNRIFVSANGGSSFTALSDNLPTAIARTIAVDSDADETIYVGMNVGIFYRSNTTSGWMDITNNLPMAPVNDLKIQQQGRLLRVATFGRGVWERPLINAVSVSCGTPTNLAVTAVSSNSATVSWDAVSGAASYVVEYKTAAASSWTVAASAITATSVNIINLSSATSYSWRVAAVCSGTAGSFAEGQFQSLVACQSPLSLVASSITETSASIGWAANGGSVNYEVAMKAATETTWTTLAASTTATSWPLTGLAAGTTYDWRVRTLCSGNSSAWVSAQFSTVAAVVCADAFEPNNNSKQAKAIQPGIIYNAGISSSTDEDWLRFSTGNNDITNVKLTLSNMPADYDVYLYDRNMRMVGASVNNGTGNDIIIFNSLARRTTYLVKIMGKNGAFNSRQCYNISVALNATAWAPEPGATIAYDDDLTGTILYPNPADKFFNLRLESKVEEAATLQLTTGTGHVVRRLPVRLFKGQNQLRFSVADLPAGVYMLQLQSGGQRLQQQLMVVH